MSTFKAGQLVQVTDTRHLAYGRMGIVVAAKKGERSQVRFADLPNGIAASDDPTGFVNIFADDELTAINDVPIAAFYALVTISERNGDQDYTHYCLAHGDGDLDAVAQAIAQNWYPEGGEWDDNENAYIFYSDRSLTASAQDWEEIPLAEYIQFRRVLADCTPGFVSGPIYGEDTEAEYIRRQTRGL